MEMIVDFPGGDRVDAHFGPFTVMTDQPSPSGEAGSAPTPFSLFLASIATCAGIYVLGFCKQRNLPTEGIRIIQRSHTNKMTGMVENVDLEIQIPAGFPEKYLPSLVRSAELCAVKKHIENPPEFKVFTQMISMVEMP
jgi:ribosomal protein S12 methylthiotransferase accessory factor